MLATLQQMQAHVAGVAPTRDLAEREQRPEREPFNMRAAQDIAAGELVTYSMAPLGANERGSKTAS